MNFANTVYNINIKKSIYALHVLIIPIHFVKKQLRQGAVTVTQDLPLLSREKREAIADSVCLELASGYAQALKDWVQASFAGENPAVFQVRITMAYGTRFVQRVEQVLDQASEKNELPQGCLIHILAEKFGLSAHPGNSAR